METSSPRRLKRSERARQMREAQRRRRERLRKDHRRFLQIILPENLRTRLYSMSERNQQTLQDFVLTLIQQAIKDAPADDAVMEDGHHEVEIHDDMSNVAVSVEREAEMTSHLSDPVPEAHSAEDFVEEHEVVEDAMESVEFVPENELESTEDLPAEVEAEVEIPESGHGNIVPAVATQEEGTAEDVPLASSGKRELPESQVAGEDEGGKPRRRKGQKPTNQMELF